MIVEFLNRLFSSSATRDNIEERQLREIREQEQAASTPVAASDVKHIAAPTRNTTPTSTTNPFANDIKALEDRFGSLQEGMEINLSLRQALEIMPRERRKADAYKGLKSELRRVYGVSLNVGGNNNNATNQYHEIRDNR